MRMKVGDDIRAHAGGATYWNGVIDSIAFGKIRVRTVTGHIIEVNQRGDHTINGIKPGAPDTPFAMLRDLDALKNLSEWEAEFVGDLVQSGQRSFSPKQIEQIERIFKRRIQDA